MENEKRIFKYDIPITDEFELELPIGAKILTFQMQYDRPVIWAIVGPDFKSIERVSFRIFGTGHPIEEDIKSLIYIGTALTVNGAVVWHLFQKIKGGKRK